jgi:hypothetical protein
MGQESIPWDRKAFHGIRGHCHEGHELTRRENRTQIERKELIRADRANFK